MSQKQTGFYKNFVLYDDDVLIDYHPDFEVENFDYDAFEQTVEKKIHEIFPKAEVYFLRTSLQLTIRCREEMEEDIRDIWEGIDISDESLYQTDLLTYDEFAVNNLSEETKTKAMNLEVPSSLTQKQWEEWCNEHLDTTF